MIDIPTNITIDETPIFADWVELCVLLGDEGTISFAKLADVVRDAGLIGTARSDIPLGDETFLDADNFTEEEAGERFAEEVWEHLSNRYQMLKSSYPLDIEGDRAKRREDSWKDSPSFAFLLIADLSRFYPASKISTESTSKFPDLFEKVVEACSRGLFRGMSVRFGVPREAGWPAPIEERIEILGDRMGLRVENLEGKIKSKDKDRGLDVAARLSFSDDGPGTLVFLIQCATGKNWKRKRGEPSITAWADIFQWNAKLVRAIAIPWRLEGPAEYRDNFRYFDSAIVLDRIRLSGGMPDSFLNQEVKEWITSWCETQIGKFPAL